MSVVSATELATLELLEKRCLWLAMWMIHNANHIRENKDGVKVGGHQASSASMATVLAALYFHTLRPEDRIAVKPHSGPVFHAIQYLMGNQTIERMKNFRMLGGVQPYPSRTKDKADVDFSTGSVGLGVAETLFASLVQDYVRAHGLGGEKPKGRMIAMLGDAELDEGNVYEALLEGWKHEVRNLWWIVDYNRQSLDGVINDQLFGRIAGFFEAVDWKVVTLKYGLKLQAAFKTAIGPALQKWIDDCPNQRYSALTFQGGAAWREELKRDLKDAPGLDAFLSKHDDDTLATLMTNLGGHDMQAILEAFAEAEKSDTPHCFIAYTIKGYGLPLAGHKDNHAGIMTEEQIAKFRTQIGIPEGREWEPLAGLEARLPELQRFLKQVPFGARVTREKSNRSPEMIVVHDLPVPTGGARMSTQESFGKIMNELGRSDTPLAARVVTTSPDVTVSTNLGGWVNQRSPFHITNREDIFRQMHVASPQKWAQSPKGQHIELGIAENNLFLMLSALGLSDSLFDARLLPVGTLYDPFIARGLDAMTYACYQDARFMLVATPSGLTLGPEGGAHQSMFTPLIGIGHPSLVSYEPAYADELAAIMTWSFDHMQQPDGNSIYLRLSTRPLIQPQRTMTPDLRADILAGAYWIKRPAPGSDFVLATCGVVAPEAEAAFDMIAEDIPGAGLLAVTSPDRLHAGWRDAARARRGGQRGASSHIERLLSELSRDATLVTLHDAHPAALSWMGSVRGQRCEALGVDRFGQAGDISSLYREYGIDTETVVDAVADVVVHHARGLALAAE